MVRKGHFINFRVYNNVCSTIIYVLHFFVCLQIQAIPGPFLDRHPMHLYMTAVLRHQQIEYTFDLNMDYHKENPGRTNHVNAFGEWEQFGLDCHFEYNKMLRFRLLYIVTDLNDPQQLSYPFFHVC